MIVDTLNLTRYRFERKFLVPDLNRYEIESIVKHHPAIFSEIYHQRLINNIYFDTINMSAYFDNLAGIGQRLKVRIRWYGESFGFVEKPVLELKIKRGLLGAKIRYPLASIYLDSKYSLEVQQDIFAKSGVPDVLAEQLKSLRFALLNRYNRKYFESANHKFRVTIDYDMEVFKLDSASNSFIGRISDRRNVILELKYSDEDDEGAKFITNRFPFRMTKSSKYVAGMDRFYSV